MNFKKFLKISALISGTIGATVGAVFASNKIIFTNAKKKDIPLWQGNSYESELGNINYIKKGSGQPLVLIHGLTLGSSHREFYKNIDKLSQHSTVYALDLPGFGYSDKPKITYTAFVYAAFINKFILDVVGESATVLGANGGGMLAVITAKLFPSSIKKLILVSPTGICDIMAANDDVYTRTLYELPLVGETIYTSTMSKKNIKNFLAKDGIFAIETIDDEIINQFYHGAHGTNTDARYAYASFKTHYMNMDIQEYFKHLDQDVCILWGRENTLNPVKNMDILNQLKPTASYYLFEETKMYPHIENPDEFNSIIKENL